MTIQAYTRIELAFDNAKGTQLRTRSFNLANHADYPKLVNGFNNSYAEHPIYSAFYQDILNGIARAYFAHNPKEAKPLEDVYFSLTKKPREKENQPIVWNVSLDQEMIATVKFGFFPI